MTDTVTLQQAMELRRDRRRGNPRVTPFQGLPLGSLRFPVEGPKMAWTEPPGIRSRLP